MYGQPITLHYEGDDTFKTCPGGMISMVLLLIIFCYFLTNGKSMLKREGWSLIQQTVVSGVVELNQPYDMKDEGQKNISIAI
jgi:DMSO/TMAO reductase YedYZ heme-binding membrane subunit